MKFNYKTDAELEGMTAQERDQYTADKRAYEGTLMKTTIADAIAEATKSLEAKIEAKVGEIDTLKQLVNIQGERIAEQSKNVDSLTPKTLANVFEERYNEAVSKTNDDAVVRDSFRIDTKANTSQDVMTVGVVPGGVLPNLGGSQAVSAGAQTLFGKIIGYFGYRKPFSAILDLCDVMPMDNATLIAVNETVTGDAAVTVECAIKPVARIAFTTQEKSADAIAVEWNSTTKMRRFFPALLNRMELKFADLVNDKLPAAVLAEVLLNAPAFTPNAAYRISTTPNNYDAIGAVIASLELLGKTPTAVILNPIAWRNMKQEKTNGVYSLSNGASIAILDNYLDWGGTPIQIVKDPTMAINDFVVGDLFDAVKVGADSQLLYFETDGRTDQQGSSSITGLSRNIRTHVLEKYFAVIVPTANRIGLVKDTFPNVKALIQ